MEELDLEDFRHGGANVTGFRLLRPDSPRTREADREWKKLNLKYSKGSEGGRKIPVSTYFAKFNSFNKSLSFDIRLLDLFVSSYAIRIN